MQNNQDKNKILNKPGDDFLKGQVLSLLKQANSFLQLKQFPEAISCYRRALQDDPGNLNLCQYFASLLFSMGEYQEAENHYLKLVEYNYKPAENYDKLAIIAGVNGDYNKAAEYNLKAIEQDSGNYLLYFNLAYAYENISRYDEAEAVMRQCLGLNPDFVEGHYSLATLLLKQGKLAEGWQEYEWRFLRKDVFQFNFKGPCWQGEPLQGKKLYIHFEQGLGDTIQFCRYIPLLKQENCTIIFRCQKELKSLFQDFPGIDTLIDTGPEPEYDYYIRLISLAGIFTGDIAAIRAQIPYFKADAAKVRYFRTKLSGLKNFRIGIAWSPKPSSKTFLRRSCSLKDFAELLTLEGVSLVSLQKGRSEKDLADYPEITDLSGDIKDFSDTAAIIENLDLVISIDTSVTHLTGAMAIPVWTLLPYNADWRWLTAINDSPWYPTMKLFRQPEPGNWQSVFEEVKAELEKVKEINGIPPGNI